MKQLSVGGGNKKETKSLRLDINDDFKFKNLTTLDIDPRCNPDILWDLREFPYPIKDEEFDEIHAYEVLEHIAMQGDWEHFFREFNEYWRILKPGGHFFASVPDKESVWLWADPGHKRVIFKETLKFLEYDRYAKEIGKTNLTDYRHVMRCNWEIVWYSETTTNLYFILKKKEYETQKAFFKQEDA